MHTVSTRFLKIVFILSFLFKISPFYSQDFEVSPIKMSFNAQPGEIQIKTLNVTNHSQNKAIFSVKLSDFLINNDGQRNYLQKGTTNNSLNEWLEISPNFLEVNPNETKTITIKINAPQDDFSSKWGILFVETSQEQSAFGADAKVATGVKLSPQIAVLVFQSPKATDGFDLKINQLKEITLTTDTKRQFSANVENKGNQIVTCKINLVAANLQTAEETIFPPEQYDIYPNSSRLIKLTLPNQLAKGKYSLSAILTYCFSYLNNLLFKCLFAANFLHLV